MAMLKSGVAVCTGVLEQEFKVDEDYADEEDLLSDFSVSELFLKLLASVQQVNVKVAAANAAAALSVCISNENPTIEGYPFVVGFFISKSTKER